jgi:hypothetical protein
MGERPSRKGSVVWNGGGGRQMEKDTHHARRIHPVPQRCDDREVRDGEQGVELILLEGLVAGGVASVRA